MRTVNVQIAGLFWCAWRTLRFLCCHVDHRVDAGFDNRPSPGTEFASEVSPDDYYVRFVLVVNAAETQSLAQAQHLSVVG